MQEAFVLERGTFIGRSERDLLLGLCSGKLDRVLAEPTGTMLHSCRSTDQWHADGYAWVSRDRCSMVSRESTVVVV